MIDNQSVNAKSIYYDLRNCINPINEFFDGIFYFTDRMKENVVDNRILQPFPKSFNTIQFWTVRRQKKQVPVFLCFVLKTAESISHDEF